MAFYARNFIFDDITSESLGLTISSESAEASTNAATDVELITETIYNRPKVFLHGVIKTPVLEFPISFNSQNEIDAVRSEKIAQKLFGKNNYRKLQVVAPDYTDVYWNCFLTKPMIKRVRGMIIGWTCNVKCDSPWGYSFSKSKTYTYAGYAPENNKEIFANNSDDEDGYLKPVVSFTMSASGGSLSIVNHSDNDRLTRFTGLSANEVITLNSDLETLTTTTNLLRLNNFNLLWPRFIAGENELTVTGNINSLSINYIEPRKVGG